MFEYAVNNCLVETPAIAGARERLAYDLSEGYVTTVFTSSPKEAAKTQLKEAGLAHVVNQVLTTNDVGLPKSALKEDPLTFVKLSETVDASIKTYTDDDVRRLGAAVTANEQLRIQGKPTLGTLFHYKPKAGSVAQNQGYVTVNNLMQVVVPKS